MDFSAFDTKKLDEYNKQAKEQWGKTEAYDAIPWNAHGGNAINVVHLDGHTSNFQYLPQSATVAGTGYTVWNYYVEGPSGNANAYW